jgi:hypothetical protein
MEPSHGFNKKSHAVLDVLGPTVKFLVLPSECAGDYCVIRGTIPPGVSVPLHSHRTVRVFFCSPAVSKLWSNERMLSSG